MHTGGRRANIDRHLDALWYIARNGCAWRALPSDFGNWFTVYQFFNRLSLKEFFDFLHERLVCGEDGEAVYFDSTHCKVHQHANGAQSRENEAIGTSRGGLNTKVHMVVDALGRLAAKMILTPGNVSDHTAAPSLTESLKDTAGVGDKGYDSRKYRDKLRSQGCEPCIPARQNTKNPEPYDEALYRTRHCIENKFQRIKVFRRVATRYETTKRMFLMFITVALSSTYEKDDLWPPM